MALRALSYLKFLSSVHVKPEAGQRIYCAVCFDGAQRADFTGEDRKVFDSMFGPIDHIPDLIRAVIITVVGARSGKTYLSALRLLHLGLIHPLLKIAPGQVAYGALVAPDKATAREALNYIRGAVDELEGLRSRVTSDGADHLEITRPDGRIIRFEVFAASRGGRSLRGRWYFGALLDEAAFFYGEDGYTVNDADLFAAVAPRVLPGGQVLVPSTPWAKLGLLFSEYEANFGHPETALAVHATTRAMRTDPMVLEVVTREEKRDPDNAQREYGAEFLNAVASLWFTDDELSRSVDNDLVLGTLPGPRTLLGAGGDLGFARNSSALGISHRRGELVTLADLLELRPKPGEPLRPSEVIAKFAKKMKEHGAGVLMADRHYRETAVELLIKRGLHLEDAPADPAEPFVTLRNLAREHNLRLPNDPLLLAQLRGVRSRAGTGGASTIVLPKSKDGRHADVAVAAALSVHQAWMRSSGEVAAEKPKLGTVEHTRRLEEELEARHEQRVSREAGLAWWQSANDADDSEGYAA